MLIYVSLGLPPVAACRTLSVRARESRFELGFSPNSGWYVDIPDANTGEIPAKSAFSAAVRAKSDRLLALMSRPISLIPLDWPKGPKFKSPVRQGLGPWIRGKGGLKARDSSGSGFMMPKPHDITALRPQIMMKPCSRPRGPGSGRAVPLTLPRCVDSSAHSPGQAPAPTLKAPTQITYVATHESSYRSSR
jgi:hypothetical protein